MKVKRGCKYCGIECFGPGKRCEKCGTKSQLNVIFPTTKQPNRPWQEMIGKLYKEDEKFQHAVDEFIKMLGKH